MLTEAELVVGQIYFMVTYPDGSLLTPIVLSYRYLGRDFPGGVRESAGSEYHFRYLPAFQDEIAETAEASWEQDFPKEFAGWGEKVPTAFAAAKLKGFLTLDGLIQELTEVRARALARPKR